MAKKGTPLHYRNVHSQTALSLLSQLQSLRKYIYLHMCLRHLIFPCQAHKTVMDHFLPAVAETLPSTCTELPDQKSEIRRQSFPWDRAPSAREWHQDSTEKPFQLQPVPFFPHHWGQVTQTEKHLGTWPSISVRTVCFSYHLKTRNNSITQKSDDSLHFKYWQAVFHTTPMIQWNIFITTQTSKFVVLPDILQDIRVGYCSMWGRGGSCLISEI